MLKPNKELLEHLAKIVDQPLLSDEEVEWMLTRPTIYNSLMGGDYVVLFSYNNVGKW